MLSLVIRKMQTVLTLLIIIVYQPMNNNKSKGIMYESSMILICDTEFLP